MSTFRPVVFGAALLAALGSASAFAQIAPDDSGRGTKLGMAQMSNSGEVGTVTLFPHRTDATLVVVRLASAPPGRAQPAHIHRGHSCDTADPTPAYLLAPVVNGVSRTIVEAPEAKLLSGNYVIDVHDSSGRLGRYVSCGELYR